MRSGLGRISLVILVLAAAAACDANKPSRSGAPASTQASHAAGHTATTTVPANASPKQRCAQFEQLLGEHALVAVRVMRSVVAPAPELRPAADTALRDNTVALSQLVSAAYGRASGDRFAQPWQHHVTDLLAYANGVAAKDASATQTARTALLADAQAYGSWLAGASKDKVKTGAAAAGVRMHVQELMAQADAYAAATTPRPKGSSARPTSTCSPLVAGWPGQPRPRAGDRLRCPAGAIPLGVRDAARGTHGADRGCPTGDLCRGARVQGGRRPGQRQQQRSDQGHGRDRRPRKAAEFQSAWANHVEGLLAYSTAVAGNDQAAKAVAEENLRGIAGRLALYLRTSSATSCPWSP